MRTKVLTCQQCIMTHHQILESLQANWRIFGESKINYGVGSIFCVLEKEEKKWWNKFVREGKPPYYVKVDWDKWADEDDDTSAADPDLGEWIYLNLEIWAEWEEWKECWVEWKA